jgi:hypothetical protein
MNDTRDNRPRRRARARARRVPWVWGDVWLNRFIEGGRLTSFAPPFRARSTTVRLRPRLRKDPTGHSVWVWYEDPDLLRCHQAPIHAELPS